MTVTANLRAGMPERPRSGSTNPGVHALITDLALLGHILSQSSPAYPAHFLPVFARTSHIRPELSAENFGAGHSAPAKAHRRRPTQATQALHTD